MSTLTLTEVKEKLSSKILLESLFIETELTEPILDAAISSALNTMDSYRPRIVRLTEPTDQEGFYLLRAYRNEFDVTSQESFVEEFLLDTATLYLYSAPWTAETLYNDRMNSHRIHFADLVMYKAGILMANKRRAVDLSNLPFDLKGDQLYGEYSEKYSALVELLQNTVRNTL